MGFPEELHYTEKHEWIRNNGETATVGITDYAQNALGDVVFVEMPEKGTMLSKNDAFGVIESVKAASDIYSPASGEVIAINESLEEHPEYVNQSPYGEGWIIELKIKDKTEFDTLMKSSAYESFVKKEEEG